MDLKIGDTVWLSVSNDENGFNITILPWNGRVVKDLSTKEGCDDVGVDFINSERKNGFIVTSRKNLFGMEKEAWENYIKRCDNEIYWAKGTVEAWIENKEAAEKRMREFK